MKCREKAIHPMKSETKTYYERPILNKITGRYTVEWTTKKGLQHIKVNTRFRDFEGYYPSIKSILALPSIIKSYQKLKKNPILKKPVPFLVVDAVHFLNKIVRPRMRILEIGGGNSTLYFLNKGCSVITIEHSKQWANFITKYIDSDVITNKETDFQLKILKGQDAINFLKKLPDNTFDVVLIDCADEYTRRNDCVETSRSKIKKGGWMVLDDSDHPSKWLGVDLMSDYERLRFTGYKTMCLNVSQTSFWKIGQKPDQ